MIRFGPGGNSEKFYEEGFKSSIDMPNWLGSKGLSAYEYQCTRGVKIKEKTARELGSKAKENNILLSIHAPYYLNLATDEEQKKVSSIRYIIESLQAAYYMEAKRVVFHPGAIGKGTRIDALNRAIILFKEVIVEADQQGLLDNAYLCPELMGKINQLGDLDEIIELCMLDERILPTIDFGHLNARTHGELKTEEDFLNVLNLIEDKLGRDRLNKMHIHFSRIEFTKGGEKKHWNFDDIQFGPEYCYLAKAMITKKIEPVIICESKTNMVEDAIYMKNLYEELKN